MRKLVLLLSALLLTGCASLQPSVKAVCGVCQSVCPLVSLTPGTPQTLACPKGQLRVMNWKDVEKKGEKPVLECH